MLGALEHEVPPQVRETDERCRRRGDRTRSGAMMDDPATLDVTVRGDLSCKVVILNEC